MTFFEAIEVARRGSKVKRDDSTGDVVIWKDGYLANERGHSVEINQWNMDHAWQIVPDPPKTYTFMEALEMMKQGRVMQPVIAYNIDDLSSTDDELKFAKFQIKKGKIFNSQDGYHGVQLRMIESLWQEA